MTIRESCLPDLSEFWPVISSLFCRVECPPGKYDFVPTVLRDLGAAIHFHKVAQKPGRPLLFATTESNQIIFGLPGNPVSALACARRYIVPSLQTSMGQSTEVRQAVLQEDVEFKKAAGTVCPSCFGA